LCDRIATGLCKSYCSHQAMLAVKQALAVNHLDSIELRKQHKLTAAASDAVPNTQ
jgi:hypothetical protein